MDYKKRCLRETKKFLKNTFDTMYSAFCMGFDDGANGERQTLPELPDPDEGLPQRFRTQSIRLLIGLKTFLINSGRLEQIC